MTKDGGMVTAKKGRDRLTVYVDKDIIARFKVEADTMYRSMSDHINAILVEYYKTKDGPNGVTTRQEKGGGGR